MAMQDVFGRQTQFGGSFNGNELVVNIAGFGSGFLITSLGYTYQAPISRVRELGSPRVYFIDGDGSGTVQIERIAGPSRSLANWVRAYSDVAGVSQNILDITLSTGQTTVPDGDNKFLLEGVLFQQMESKVTSEGPHLMAMALSGTFENLLEEMDSGAAGILNTAANIAGAL